MRLELGAGSDNSSQGSIAGPALGGVLAGVGVGLALGATAVGIGRPYGYGAVLGGTAGIEFVLSCLLAEADLTMSLNGYASIAELTRDILVRV
jgi:lactate 2-monooxygenase